ncbi:linoleate 9S-lipoxygenase 6-like [Cucurbita pepo subsp. pepo]|uniref:linoleate 9S-lipoxygenase 6-like n=1 Tax=Cucurbita pepo subsp. pepo TaxID=3664 RepID=UPI000C9D4F08|nr:linoleate 9S-lipoxygenase 6-like [Cucurbita pepo subsp. pepo]
MFGIGKNLIGDALKTTGDVLRTTGDVAGSVVNAGGNIVDRATDIGRIGKKKIKGKVILMRSNVLDFTELHSTVIDGVTELLGSGIVLELVSATHVDRHSNDPRGKVGRRAYLERWLTSLPPLFAGESVFQINFEWDEEFGYPGAFYIRNGHTSEFFLKSLTLEDVPGYGKVHFDCNSWVYPQRRYNKDRIFFANKTYLPSETPAPLRKYREEELINLRGDGKGERKEWDRIYDYDVYNDIADSDGGNSLVRPILGGDKYPYPRRGRTGRPRTRRDPSYESRLQSVVGLNIYVPRDENFGHLKMADFLAYSLKSLSSNIKPGLETIVDRTPGEIDNFKQVHDLYDGGFPIPFNVFRDLTNGLTPPMFKELLRTDGERFLRYPVPHIIKDDKSAWRTDEEFAREMLAGVNPICISRLQQFPPVSKLDPSVYGNQNSTISEENIKYGLNGLSVNEAIEQNKLYILDHHDALMPYLRKINSTSTKTYATRTLLLLQDDGTLKPLVIELSLPHPQGDRHGAISKLYYPAEGGVESSIWQLAKAYVAVNDVGYHQLISHWLHTHAVVEPFVIATHRQLSVLHPIHKLLIPHYKDTMFINAFARQILVNAGGLLEETHFQSKYAMELSSYIYKDWNFLEQALPVNLIKRGVAVEDASSPHGLRLLIGDYPFANDGLEIWSTIQKWVTNYCSLYYKDDEAIQNDVELQSWWKEVREKGHADKKNEPWWPKMNTIAELVESCTIIIWIASALHAAVNFGQYPYGGFVPNRPTISRRLMPEVGSSEYKELEANPEKAYLRTINSQIQFLLGMSLIEILSRHASDEVYLGQRASIEWTSDKHALEAFEKFGKEVYQVEERIMERNRDINLKNRSGPANFPYTLLVPSSSEGLTARGIPNSISI